MRSSARPPPAINIPPNWAANRKRPDKKPYQATPKYALNLRLNRTLLCLMYYASFPKDSPFYLASVLVFNECRITTFLMIQSWLFLNRCDSLSVR